MRRVPAILNRPHYIWMIEAFGSHELPLKALQEYRVLYCNRVNHFDGDDITRDAISRLVDRAHPAFRDFIHNIVVPQLGWGSVRRHSRLSGRGPGRGRA